MSKLGYVVLLTGLLLEVPALAEDRAYIVESGTFTYLPSPWVVNQTECGDHCDYSIRGVVRIEVSPEKLDFRKAELDVLGPELDVPPFEHVNGAFVSRQLSGNELIRADDIPGHTYRQGQLWTTLGLQSINVTGGRDHRPADGDGHIFQFGAERTWFGDSNLDFEFNSSDLVAVFDAGVFEDKVEANASWTSGDWDGSGDFDSADLVFALLDGGYNQGPFRATIAVPEPTGLVTIGIPLMTVLPRVRKAFVRLLADQSGTVLHQ